MARARRIADVDPDLRRRVRIAAAQNDSTISDWVERAVRRELEREEGEANAFSRASSPVFARDWNSDEDSAYDELGS